MSGCDGLIPSSELPDSSTSSAENQSIEWSTLGDEAPPANASSEASAWTRTFEVRATDDPESRLLLAYSLLTLTSARSRITA